MARRARRMAAAIALLLLVGCVAIVWAQRLQFPYEGPEGTVTAGEEITIRDPGATCGPLFASIWRPSILGQWNQIRPDVHRWWQLWDGSEYSTNVPCYIDGKTTYTVPADLEPGVIAVCDVDLSCARLEVSE